MAETVNENQMAGRRQKLRDRWRNRGRIAAALRSAAGRGEFPRLVFWQYFALADACCDVANESTNTDMDEFIGDCCGGGAGTGFELFEAKVAEKVGGPLIDLITQLLPILLPLIIGCFG